MRTVTRAVLGIMAVGSALLLGSPAFASPTACQREIAKSFAKFTQARIKLLTRCHDAVLSGKSVASCPDPKTAAALAQAESKLRSAIQNKCGGPDHVCGAGTDETLASIGWDTGACRNFENGACTNPIADCGDVADCLVCVGDAAVDQAADLYYGHLQSSGDSDVVRCQREIGKSAVKAFRAETKAMQKCADARLAGTASGSCPDGKASAAVSYARAKAIGKICRACGGSDGACGGSGDIAPGTIGFAARCPSVTVPGGNACGGPITDLQSLVSCVGCLTAFKAECTDALAAPMLATYPAACNADPDATPTPGSGVPTPTATPHLCGNGTIDAGEECDGANAAACPGQCTASCRCPAPCVLPAQVPEIMNLEFLPGLDSDNGWTGIANDVPYGNDQPFGAGRLANCDWNLDSPTCGQCDVVGSAQYRGAVKNCLCTNLADRDASSRTACDPENPSCGGGESCQCYQGAVLPVSSGGAPGCIVNRFTQPLTGTVNVALSGPHAGESDLAIRVESAVHNGLGLAKPCPQCLGDPVVGDGVKGGTCDVGPRAGQPCDVAGTHDLFGTVTFDCPPFAAANIGNLDIRAPHESTGVVTLVRGTRCTAQAGADCACNTCATAAAEPCNGNADCPPGIACGGRRCIGGTKNGTPCANASECDGGGLCNRPGEPSQQNACTDGVCSPNPSDPNGPDEGVCEAGPIDRLCSVEKFRSCSVDGDCNPPPAGNCSDCAGGQVCEASLRQCFLDPISRTGTPGVQTAIVGGAYCMTPVASASINKVSGWPGPGTVRIPLRRFFGPASCGNGTLDANEQCDTGHDAACPGQCQPDCRCPAQPTCGDGQVNQASEQCDGIDAAACPGACAPDCTCGGATCGNGTKEAGEQCDGADDVACPGACQGDCTCGPFCGDGHVDAGEQCDGAGSTACPPAACQADCTCGPYCGNNQIDPGEECDGTGTGQCTGSCQSDCHCAAVCGDNQREAGELCDGTDDSLCPGKCSSVCTCPGLGEVTLSTKPGADLDAGWTGVADNFQLQTGSVIRGELSGCDGQTDMSCDFFANVGSFCANDPSRSCTSDGECSGGTCTISYYGPPLPASAGGVPACVLIRFATDATGTYDLSTGAMSMDLTFNAQAFLGVSVSQPCPICDCGKPDLADCQIGDSGTCAGSGVIGNSPCTVQGNGPGGPTSLQCPPSSSLNVSGNGLVLPVHPLTTGAVSTPSSQPCDAAGHTNEGCWCDGQPQANACQTACDGGSNDAGPCDTDADCPGAPAGACKPLCRQIGGAAVGEAECPAGPVDRTCAGAPEISCTNDGGCPTGKGPCAAHNRRCFLDPIVKQGIAGTSTDTLVATFCVAETGSSTINTVAGLPGPGAISIPNTVDARLCGDGVVNRTQEECDRGDDSNCPGSCLPNCLCQRTCGNNTVEFGEQCDGLSDSACPGHCEPPTSANACTCPPVCGDGFIGAGEQCDPGGVGGNPPPDDALCPGLCTNCTCPVQVPTCLNNKLDPGEVCDEPAIGCGPLQACVGCLQCFPPPDVLPPISGVCGDLNITPGEVCELPAQGCPAGTLCNQCTSCVAAIPFCGNLNIEPGEACELPALGCGPNQLCALCQQCVDVPIAICGNRNIEPGEACELPQIGCGLLQGCLACQACVP